MSDMLDFFNLFWEDKLDSESSTVDNIDITKGDLTYAANDYCGVPIGGIFGVPELREAKKYYIRKTKRAKGLQHKYTSYPKSNF